MAHPSRGERLLQQLAPAAASRPGVWTRDMILIWFCRFFIFASFYQLIPTLPLYLVSRQLTHAEVGSVVAIFFLVATLTRPFAGHMNDAMGSRRLLLVALVPFALAPLGYALTGSIMTLAFFRVFHGAGFGGTSAVHVLVANVVPAERRGEVLGVYTTSSTFAGAVAPALGMWIYTQMGPTVLFLSSGATGGLAWLAMNLVPDRPAWRSQHAALPLGQYMRMFLTWDTLAITLPMAAISFATGGISTFLPLQAVARGLQNPGFYFTVYAIALIAARVFTGRLSDRHGRAAVLIPAYLPMLGALFVLAWLPGPEYFFVAAVLHGLGHGTLESGLLAALVDRVPLRRRGSAMAQWSLFFDLGIGTGGFVLGQVLSATGQNYTWAFLSAALVVAASFVFYLSMLQRHPEPQRN